MSTTTDVITHAPADASGEEMRTSLGMLDNARIILRTLSRGLGAAMVIGAFGLWLVPGSSWAPDLMIIKLGISLSVGFLGLAFWQSGNALQAPYIEVDTIRREVRLMRGRKRNKVLLARCRFFELAEAEVEDDVVRLWDHKGEFLAEVEMADKRLQQSLISGLRDAGKLE